MMNFIIKNKFAKNNKPISFMLTLSDFYKHLIKKHGKMLENRKVNVDDAN